MENSENKIPQINQQKTDNMEPSAESVPVQEEISVGNNSEQSVSSEQKPENIVTENANAEIKTDGEKTDTEQNGQKSSAQNTDIQTQPSKFALTAGQVWKIIRNFFSKNVVDAIAAQYKEKLPVWGILLPAYVLLSAISATVSFNSQGTVTYQVGNIFSDTTSFGSGEVFFINLAVETALMFAMIIGVRAFIKFHNGDGHFLSSANLVTASQLPIMMFLVFNIVTGGALTSIINTVFSLGKYAVIMLIFAGVSRVLGGKKPLWSFFLMLICVTVVAAVVAMIVISPILFSRVAYSLIDTIG